MLLLIRSVKIYYYCELCDVSILSSDWSLNHLVLLFTFCEYRQNHLQVKADIEHLLGSSIVFEQFYQEENNFQKHTKRTLMFYLQSLGAFEAIL